MRPVGPDEEWIVYRERKVAILSIELAKTLYKIPLLTEHRVRCGKPACRCVTGEGHGPYAFLYWREGAVQRRHYVKVADVAAVRAVVACRRAEAADARRIVADSLAQLRQVRWWLAELAREQAE